MADAELIQSFLPSALAEEITRRYQVGSTTLAQLVDHFSQRSQLEDLLASTIERAGSSSGGKFGSTRGSIRSHSGVGLLSNVKLGPEEVSGLVPALQKEVDALVRLHLHLSERINSEIVRPLQAFINTDAWSVAHSIEVKVRQMASEMKHHHEQIPKLSTRTVSKSARASQQAKQKLEDERSALMALQQEWQKRIAGLVDDFEAADVARIEIVRESALKFEHYKTEFFKAAQNGSGPVVDIAAAMRPSSRIVDVLSKDMHSPPAELPGPVDRVSVLETQSPQPQQQRTVTAESVATGVQSHRSESQADLDSTKDGAKPKGFLNMLRGKTKQIRKKSSTSELSISSSQHSRSISGHVATPSIISTAHTRDTRDSDGLSPSIAAAVESGIGGDPRALSRHRGDSFASSSHSARLTTEPGPSAQSSRIVGIQSAQKPSTGDFAEWVFAEGSQSGSGGAGKSQDPSQSSADSLVHINSSGLSVIEESSATEPKPATAASVLNEPATQAQGGGETPSTSSAFVADSWPESDKSLAGAQPASTSVGDASRIFGNLHDSFKVPDTPFDVAAFEPFQAGAGRISPRTPATAVADLDQAFSIPSRPQAASQTAVADQSQSDSVFGATDAFLVRSGTDVKQSPQLGRLSGGTGGGGHRRSISVGTADKSPSMSEQKLSKSKNSDDDDNNGGASDDEEDGADGAADQAFRVKFSIRERAIRDNPDESKAALSRVTTMLRAAPSVQRRNRRDVRTMYVPSALPVTEESFVQSKRAADDDGDDQPLTPLPQRLGTLSSPSSRIGDTVSEAFGGPATPLTPVPQRAESAPAAVNDPGLQNESTPPAIVPTTVGEPLESPSDDAKHAETECPSRPTDLDSMGAESSIDHTPVVAATIADAATAAVVSAQTDTSHVDGLTAESASDAKSLPKSEGSVRRRAPPPPPLAPARSSSRSVKQTSQTSLLTTASAAVPDSEALGKVVDEAAVTSEHVPPTAISAEQEASPAKTADCAVPDMARPKADEEAPQIVPSSALPALLSSHRGRRVGASSGPLAVTIHVRETLDFDFKYLSGSGPEIKHLVTGEVTMHIQSVINPLELAPLRICIQRTEATQWVANPAVVVLDASLTASKADGREWYRFVRPNLFAQVDAQTGADVAVFKYQARGSDDNRVMPVFVREVYTCSKGLCARMVFCEPNSDSHFAGDTVIDPAVLLNMVGTVTSQSSRPTAIWYQERNCLLWRVGDMHVPLPDTMSEAEMLT
ncbi:Suppressor of Profilin deletion, partial [Coemansia sp. RSA 2681]